MTSIKEPPLVSVVIPAHNAEAFIGELLSSVLAQTYKNIEVLVLDDGSTDATSHVVAQHAGDVRLKYFRSETNIGVNKATSRLLKQVRGEYWAHPGADDVLDQHFVAKRVALMERHPSASMAHGAVSYIDTRGRSIAAPYPALEIPPTMSGERALSIMLQHNIINTPSVLIRTAATRKIQHSFHTDYKYAQDWFLWLLVISLSSNILYDSSTLHYYRIHESSLTGDPTKLVTRRIETRLVPLCALSTCAKFSPAAKDLWRKWGTSLYNLFLVRLCRLLLIDWRAIETFPQAVAAYGKHSTSSANLPCLLAAHSYGMFLSLVAEKRAKRKQAFPVSGLASIDDPLFK